MPEMYHEVLPACRKCYGELIPNPQVTFREGTEPKCVYTYCKDCGDKTLTEMVKIRMY
jgi:RNase P subunit RPR2